MQHALFGSLTYGKRAGHWSGSRALPHLATAAVRSEEKTPPTQEELQQLLGEAQAALDKKKDQMREKFGPAVDQLFNAMHERVNAPPDKEEEEFGFSAEQEEEFAEREAADKANAVRRQQGLFPFAVQDPDKSGPTAEQEAAFRHLLDNEAAVRQAVLEALYESYQQYYADEHWRKICRLPEIAAPDGVTAAAHLTHLEVVREQHQGLAHLVFEVDCDWEQEHGMLVVYHRDKGAKWTTCDGLHELLGVEYDEEDFEVSGSQQLYAAVMANDQKKVQELLAEGHDINDGAQGFAPLCVAIQQMDAALVSRLLAIGADPNLKGFDNKTPLQGARSLLKNFTPKKGDKLMKAMLAMAQQVPGFGDGKAKVEEIIRLLEAAGAK